MNSPSQENRRPRVTEPSKENIAFGFSNLAEDIEPKMQELFTNGRSASLEESLNPLLKKLDVLREDALEAVRGTYETIPTENAPGRADAVWALTHLHNLSGTLRGIIVEGDKKEILFPCVSRKAILSQWDSNDQREELLSKLNHDLLRMQRMDEYLMELGVERSDNNKGELS